MSVMGPADAGHPILPPHWETPRLLLRRPELDDLESLQAAIEESFEDLHRWMPWAIRLQPLEETKAFIERTRAGFGAGEDFGLLGFLKDTGQFVLGSGLHPRNWKVPCFEVGYWCRRSMQRQGYTTEAVRSITQMAFSTMGAVRLEIRCDSRNEASRRVAEAAGYRLEAVLHSEDRGNDGTLRDTLVLARLREAPTS
jgi:RimJ/RimL family protein N-acetyltransferase